MLDSINFVITPPKVSIPKESGVTSSNNTSLTSPVNTPPWIAAPTATTSSGLTPLEGALPKNSSTFFCTAGIRVEPPTKITSLMSDALTFAFFNARRQGSMVACTRWSVNCSNCDRVKVLTKCFGIPSTGNMYGKLISVEVELESSILAFSAASFRRW